MQRPQARSSTHSCCLVAQSCPLFCNPVDCSPPGSSVRGILQARVLEGVHFLLQGVFVMQGSNPGLLHCQLDSLPTEPRGKSSTRSRSTENGHFSCLNQPHWSAKFSRLTQHAHPTPSQAPSSKPVGDPTPSYGDYRRRLAGWVQPASEGVPPTPPGAHGVRCRGCPQKVACPESQAQQSLQLPLATAPAPGEPAYLQHLGRARAARTARAGRALDED